MKSLSNVTLVSIINGDSYIIPTIKSMEVTLRSIIPASSIIVCPQKIPSHSSITHIEDPVEGDYSQWILANLHKFITTDFCLVHQWDSCVLDNSKWSDEFLKYDYIGAPWDFDGSNRVGNGGFSLRSKKFLLECSKIAHLLPVGQFINGNEDYFACVTAYNYLKMKGCKYAPLNLARQFSVERSIREKPHKYEDLSTYESWGFHGEFNISGMSVINNIQ